MSTGRARHLLELEEGGVEEGDVGSTASSSTILQSLAIFVLLGALLAPGTPLHAKVVRRLAVRHDLQP